MKSHIVFISILLFSVTVFSQENKGKEQIASNVPDAVANAFKTKLPDATIITWKVDGSLYIASFKAEEQQGIAEFTADGAWHATKYPISEKELPGLIMRDFKTNYKLYKIKISEMVQEPGAQDYYYLFIKKDSAGHQTAELYYTLAGKFIKKVIKEDKKINDDTEKATKTDTTKANTEKTEVKKTDASEKADNKITSDDTEIKNTVETISSKELPSPAIKYVKQKYPGYSIKEAILNTTDEGTSYIVKIKKEGKKALTELTFDIKGKFMEPKKK
ncbi:MAG: PepSY-like domain-containing protein [Bacteroidales bacterium]